MKNLILLTCLTAYSSLLKSQDSDRKFEFGSTLLTVNSFNDKYIFAPDRPAYEVMNGLFFRYNKDFFAYRGIVSYNESNLVYNAPANSADMLSGEENHKDFRIGIGFQMNFRKSKDWFYGFGDACYRNVFTNGISSGGLAGKTTIYSHISNCLDTYVGLGLKLKILKYAVLSPELAYNITYTTRNSILTDAKTANVLKVRAFDLNIRSILKLHATVKF